MPAPAIILSKGQMLVTKSGSILGILPIGNNQYSFGTVALIYDTSNDIAEGDTILFNSKTSDTFMYGSTVYYLVEEKNVAGNEGVAP